MNKISISVNMGDANSPDWQYFVLPEDVSVSMTHNSPMFNDKTSGTFSESITLYAEVNRHIIGNADSLHSGSVWKILHRRYFRVYFDGAPVLYGIIRVDKNVSIKKGKFEIELASDGQDFSDEIADMNARDVDISDDHIVLGTTVEKVRVSADVAKYTAKHYGQDPERTKGQTFYDGGANGADIKEHYIISDARDIYLDGKSFFMANDANQSKAYPEAKYCYNRKAFQQYEYARKDADDEDSDYEWKAVSPRSYVIVSPNNKRYLTPNFYVAYFLEKLFKQMGYCVVQNDMQDLEDWNRLAFVNGALNYETEGPTSSHLVGYIRPEDTPIMSGSSDITWTDANGSQNGSNGCPNLFNYFALWEGKNWSFSSTLLSQEYETEHHEDQEVGDYDFIYTLTTAAAISTLAFYAEVVKCIATSDNFPDEAVDSILEALSHAFNIRFVTDSNEKTVKIVSIDKVMKAANVPTEIQCDVRKDITKKDYGVDGYRLMYSGSNVESIRSFNNKKTFDGDHNDARYNYCNYRDAIVRNWSNRGTAEPFDKNCYIDPRTGNAIRIRVDEDAEQTSELHPSYFEVGSCIPAELGDCSKMADDEGRVKEVSIGFEPIEMNLLGSNHGDMLAQLVDEEIHPTLLTTDDTIASLSDASTPYTATAVSGDGALTKVEKIEVLTGTKFGVDVSCEFGYMITEKFSFSRSSGNDEHPLLSQDFGFMLGVMRGTGNSGTDATTPATDVMGNTPIQVQTNKFSNFSMDCVDNEARWFDYNGDAEGIGGSKNSKNWQPGRYQGFQYTADFNVSAPTLTQKAEAASYILSMLKQTGNVDLATRKLLIESEDISSIVPSQHVNIFLSTGFSTVQTNNKDSHVICIHATLRFQKLFFWTQYDKDGNFIKITDFIDYCKNAYSLAMTEVKTLKQYDAEHYGCFLGYCEWNNLGADVYGGARIRTAIDIAAMYINGLAKDYKEAEDDTSVSEMESRFSLKLKAEKPIHQSELAKRGSVNDGEGYFSVTGAGCAKRGLFDKFHKRYARFLIDAQEADIPVENISLRELMGLNDFTLYRIAGVTGFVLSYTYKLDNEKGLRDVVIKMLYN